MSASRTPTVQVRELQAYGRTLYTPTNDVAREFSKLCTGRANFSRDDLTSIEKLGFTIQLLPTEWRVR
jgi:hypothetical protein